MDLNKENNQNLNIEEQAQAAGEQLPEAVPDEAAVSAEQGSAVTDAPATEGSGKVKVPLSCLIVYGIGGVALIVYLLCRFFTPVADFVNRYISSAFRAVTATVSGILPFSLAETIVVIAVPMFIATVVWVFAVLSKDDAKLRRSLYRVMALAVAMFSLFVFAFAPGYRTDTLDHKLGLTRALVSVEELTETAEILMAEIEAILDGASEQNAFGYTESGASVRPYSHREMVKKLNDAYAAVQKEYPTLLPRLRAPVKKIALSVPMTYTHISGVYSFFTGEANLNTNFPDYVLPYTAAHEMGHQRGIAREDEANFVAFLVCDASDDPYIRYSGYMNMLEYVFNALYSADPDAYVQLLRRTPSYAYGEMRAYAEFFEKYRDSTAAEVSSAVNDTYLKAHGVEAGERSYGMVVDLAVSYFAEK